MKRIGIKICVMFCIISLVSCSQPTLESSIEDTSIKTDGTILPLDTPPDLEFQADAGIRLIDTWAEENKAYKNWIENMALDLRNRPNKHYLTDATYILEDENKLFYIDEQTDEKKLVLEGDLLTAYSSENIEEYKPEGVYFGDKIDEQRFTYIIPVFEWYGACGIFDVSDFSDHPITISGETRTYKDIYGDFIYTYSEKYSKTNVHTYETTIIMPDLETDYNFFYNGNFSRDGKLFAYIKSNTEDKGNTEFTVKVFDVERQELLASFDIQKTDVKLFWYAQFIDRSTIYFLEDGLVENARYLLEVDINGIEPG